MSETRLEDKRIAIYMNRESNTAEARGPLTVGALTEAVIELNARYRLPSGDPLSMDRFMWALPPGFSSAPGWPREWGIGTVTQHSGAALEAHLMGYRIALEPGLPPWTFILGVVLP